MPVTSRCRFQTGLSSRISSSPQRPFRSDADQSQKYGLHPGMYAGQSEQDTARGKPSRFRTRAETAASPSGEIQRYADKGHRPIGIRLLFLLRGEHLLRTDQFVDGHGEITGDLPSASRCWGIPRRIPIWRSPFWETNSAWASSSCVSLLLFRSSCSFSLNSIPISSLRRSAASTAYRYSKNSPILRRTAPMISVAQCTPEISLPITIKAENAAANTSVGGRTAAARPWPDLELQRRHHAQNQQRGG